MGQLDLSEVTRYVEDNIGGFHSARLVSLQKLKLREVLKRKNPYLFKAKNVHTAQDLVKSLLDAHISSQEETIFGKFLEGLAIFVCSKVYGGKKSSSEGIDLEFEKKGVIYLVSIKSGPNWGNSSQVKKMRENFRQAQKILRQGNPGAMVMAINGCCYGRNIKPDKGDYLKLCGQRFWAFITDDSEVYTQIIEPLGRQAKERNEDFLQSYSQIVNLFTAEFMDDFCDHGVINWKRLVNYNSAIAPQRLKPRRRKKTN